MRGAEFKRLARQGVKSYGDDPWFFLRELAQNSRDAGARRIHVSARRDAAREVLVFSDDGRGMARDHAERFLFRLYASSKESERSSAGMYGIGFWTVLGFEPDRIEVASRTGNDGWALRLDGNLSVEEAACNLVAPGTRVILERPAAAPDSGAFRDEVRAGLNRYCRYLRRNDRASSVLPVNLDGFEINEPFRAGGPSELMFREGAVEGAVGLADSPRVELYARGLPVWEGMLLEELSHNPPPLQSAAGLETGLSPVFVLNGNDLQVVMDRGAVLDDQALRRLRKSAVNALRRLVREQLDGLPGRGAFPRLRRLLDRLRYRRGSAALAGALALALVIGSALCFHGESVLIPIGHQSRTSGASSARLDYGAPPTGSMLQERIPSAPDTPRARLSDLAALQRALASYHGAVVEAAPGEDHLPLTWSPPEKAWFRLSAAEDFDPMRGFVHSPQAAGPDAPAPLACGESCLRVRIPVAAGGSMPLPMPTGWALVPGSLRMDGAAPPLSPTLNGYGEAVVEVPARGAVLTWACAPWRSTLDADTRARLLDLDGAEMPTAFEAALHELEDLPVEVRISHVLGLTRSLVSYVEGGGPLGAGPWIRRVLERGAGDCDVMNSLTVIGLRRLGIPARLAIGFVGGEGRLRPGLHAWTEFHLGSWQAVDASATATAAVSAESPPVSEPGAETVTAPRLEERPVPPYPRPVLVTAPDAATASTSSDPISTALLILAVLSGSAALLLLVIGLLRRRRPRSWRRLAGAESTGALDHVLGRMALSWSVRPDLWGVAGFSLAPLLPRLRGGRISLERAVHLATRGRLFYGHPKNHLVSGPRRGAVVLDGSNEGFAPFIHRIPGAVDLDSIRDAAAIDPATRRGPAPDLLAAVNQVLELLGEKNARCLLAPEITSAGLRDVDLARLVVRDGLPKRFVAVDPDAPLIRAAARLYGERPALAVYQVLEWLSHRSTLSRRSPAQLRRAAARRLLRDAE